ncbi:outer membrane lipoprotein SlyB [Kushneria sinocarnis]|uniref:Outer membrane lipoprotein SlyB n=1 Tax=Kushneria sinocarnis TaxID=595502 RepID=A0A420WTA9_9GAMM|nr:glycine zipper 2TM domain-containing protein [Kushneria sinocarnis]RKQ96326.1 outer membrane lipoprotein SlyB [Kushneria sinocarnis]
MKRYLAVALLGMLTLGGCANSDIYSGNTYTGNQAKTARNVTYGTVTGVRPVTIQAGNQNDTGLGGIGGAILGGLLGNQVGGGSGRVLATAVGGIGGAVAGKKVEDSANRVGAYEIQIRTESGQDVVVVQKADTQYQVGQRVRLIGSGNSMSVAPAQ